MFKLIFKIMLAGFLGHFYNLHASEQSNRDLPYIFLPIGDQLVEKIRSSSTSLLNKLPRDTIDQLHLFVDSIPILQMSFAKIAPKPSFGIAYTFDLMQTHVTQWMWSILLDEGNPSHFSQGADAIIVEIGEKLVPMNPNFPVENVSWDDIQRFIMKLNELALAAEDSKNIYALKLIKILIADHKKGDRYRLPNENEWKFIATNRGKDSNLSFDVMLKHAWLNQNSNFSTHEVASKEPLLIDNEDGSIAKIYDVFGNVWTWLAFSCTEASYEEDEHIFQGGCWNFPLQYTSSSVKFSSSSHEFLNDLGFRLIRQSIQT